MNIKALILAGLIVAGTIVPVIFADHESQTEQISVRAKPTEHSVVQLDNAQQKNLKYDDVFDEALEWVSRKLTPYWKNKKIRYMAYAGLTLTAYMIVSAIVSPWLGQKGVDFLNNPETQKALDKYFDEAQKRIDDSVENVLDLTQKRIGKISYSSGAEWMNGAIDTLIERVTIPVDALIPEKIDIHEFILETAQN